MADFLPRHGLRQAEPIYNYLKDTPDMTAATFPVAAAQGRYPRRRALCQLRCRSRLPIPVQFLHHHQCGAANRAADRRRYRRHRARAMPNRTSPRFFITDDNYARNKNWEPILDRLIELREKEGFRIRLLLQVDTLCHKIPALSKRPRGPAAPPCSSGLKTSIRQSLAGAKKRQNKIWEYQEMFHAWRKAKVMTFAGYILGFPTDTPESIARDIEIIKKELPVDILEFSIGRPFPAPEDHKVLHMKGVPVDPDLNKYDLGHACTAHPIMSKDTWEQVYRDAWTRYYSDEHVEDHHAPRGWRRA